MLERIDPNLGYSDVELAMFHAMVDRLSDLRSACGCESCQRLGNGADEQVAKNFLRTLQQGEPELPYDPEEWRKGLVEIHLTDGVEYAL